MGWQQPTQGSRKPTLTKLHNDEFMEMFNLLKIAIDNNWDLKEEEVDWDEEEQEEVPKEVLEEGDDEELDEELEEPDKLEEQLEEDEEEEEVKV